ncbi:unnamed protein product [Linum trigynum]|uniref:Bystin n=1 Tax=Linum trigynum TaxID=586398 RepID=A0AAV2GKW4_9ROSI
MQHWEDVLYLTDPEKWSPNGMYQATRILASNLDAKKAERFCRLVLLPRIRDVIKKNKRLHFALYQALKKAIFEPAAFNKGILFPLCKSGTCNLREAVIVGSVTQKFTIPALHSILSCWSLQKWSIAARQASFGKEYALPYHVIEGLIAHYTRFMEDSRILPAIWHQSLLAFVQR